MISPVLSVIMPAFNAEKYIKAAIDSVLAQNYPQLELLVIDDGSSDSTPSIVAEYGDPVRLLQQQNRGPAAARNLGITNANGELIAFLDADDLWLPGKLAAQLRYLDANPEVGVVFGRFHRISATDRLVDILDRLAVVETENLVLDQSGWIYHHLLLDNIVHIITAVVRRSVFDSVGGFDESLVIGEDYDFWLRVSRRFRMSQLDQLMACYRIHESSTTQIPRATNYRYLMLMKHISEHGLSSPDGTMADKRVVKHHLAGACFDHGYLHYWAGDTAVARQAFGQSITHKLLQPRAWVYWLIAAIKSSLK